MRFTISGESRVAEALRMGEEATRAGFTTPLGRLIQHVSMDVHTYSRGITHKITGALARSERLDYVTGMDEVIGSITLDPMVRNPESGGHPVEYGEYEHARGGDHAFFERTFRHFDKMIDSRYLRSFTDNLPR